MAGDDFGSDVPGSKRNPRSREESFVSEVMSRVSMEAGADVERRRSILGPIVIVATAVIGVLLIGLVGFGLVGLFAGGSPPSVAAELRGDLIPVFACPGVNEIGKEDGGTPVEVTGRSGTWLAVAIGGSNAEVVFVHSHFVVYEGEVGEVGIGECDAAQVLAGEATTLLSTTTALAVTSIDPGATSTTIPGSSTSTTRRSISSTNTTTTTIRATTTTRPGSTSSSSSTTLPSPTTSTSTPVTTTSSSSTTTSSTTSSTSTTTTTMPSTTTTTTTEPTTTTTETTTTTDTSVP
jgi:hypothetical protein